ncbi:hypothetical protein BC834DRAFT_974162 [Gloeopeniophorella convolvens]|nr:hypothetical protein BC834DRAFT_974162 [Gloeopeniophorella convolvens]
MSRSVDVARASYPGPEAMRAYEFFAVINHEGQIDNGRYMSFARYDDTVYPLSLHLSTQ